MAPPLDTNILIRYLTRDNPDHSHRAYLLFQHLARGTEQASLSEGVLVEAVQVLSSSKLYNLPRTTIRERLAAIIRAPGVQLRPKRRYLRALDIYAATTLDFVDALLIAQAERSPRKTVISYDQGIGKVAGVTRTEPDASGSIS
jgi:predicted nucleic-acid-binding protein